MHVQRLVAEDVPRYRELMLHAYRSAPDAFTSTAEERSAEPDSWWLGRIADPGGRSLALGAFDGGRLVGTVTLEFSVKPKTRHKALLIGMFVHESSRRRGAGAALVEALLAEASARPDVRLVTLTVTDGNAPAIFLYERFGFRQFGVEPMAIATPDGYKAKVHMWAPVGSADRMDPKLPFRGIDYTVIFARQMSAMREFYGETLGFPLHRELSPRWIEFRVGSNVLALTEHGGRFDDPAPPVGVLSLQLAFRVGPAEVASCAATLAERGVHIISGPTDHDFGHRTLFFRDPDGNVLEIYAEI